MKRILTHAELLQLARWNTPTIYNGWEAITARDIAGECFNLEETRDFMPVLGTMIGYAVTVVIEPSNPAHPRTNPAAFDEYRAYMASIPGPKIVVIEDLDKPRVIGSFWGEVNANVHRAFGCVGTITDGGIRDLDEMTAAGFKALARRLCVGHAHVTPVRWNCPVNVFGCRVEPGQLIHADKHGFMVIPESDQRRLLEAALFMDVNELQNKISIAREGAGKSTDVLLTELREGGGRFKANTQAKFTRDGEA